MPILRYASLPGRNCQRPVRWCSVSCFALHLTDVYPDRELITKFPMNIMSGVPLGVGWAGSVRVDFSPTLRPLLISRRHTGPPPCVILGDIIRAPLPKSGWLR